MIATAVDVILALVVVEAAALALFHRRTGRGPALGSVLPNLAAGFLLMLAVRLALGDAGHPPAREAAVAAALGAALVAHVVDMARRWT